MKYQDREEAYRVYVTDSLKALGGFPERYVDIMAKATAPKETRSAEEIKDSIKDKLTKLGGESE